MVATPGKNRTEESLQRTQISNPPDLTNIISEERVDLKRKKAPCQISKVEEEELQAKQTDEIIQGQLEEILDELLSPEERRAAAPEGSTVAHRPPAARARPSEEVFRSTQCEAPQTLQGCARKSRVGSERTRRSAQPPAPERPLLPPGDGGPPAVQPCAAPPLSPPQAPPPPVHTPPHTHIAQYPPLLPAYQSPMHTPEYPPVLEAHHSPIHTPEFPPLAAPHLSPMHTPEYSPLISAHQSPMHTPSYSPMPAAYQPAIHAPQYSPHLPAHQSPIHTPDYSPLPAAHQASIHVPEYSPLLPVPQTPMPPPAYSPLPAAHQSPMHSPNYSPLPAAHQSPIHIPEYSPLLPALQSPMPPPEYSPLPAAHQSPIHTPEYSQLLGVFQSPMNTTEYTSLFPIQQPPEPPATYPPLPTPYGPSPLPMPQHGAQPPHPRSSLPTGEATSCSNAAQADQLLFQRPHPWLTTHQGTSEAAHHTPAVEEPTPKVEEAPWLDILKKFRPTHPRAPPRPSPPATPRGAPRAPPERAQRAAPKDQKHGHARRHQPKEPAPLAPTQHDRRAKEFAFSHEQPLPEPAARQRQAKREAQPKRPPLLQTPSLPPALAATGHAPHLSPHEALSLWGRRSLPPHEDAPQRMRTRRSAHDATSGQGLISPFEHAGRIQSHCMLGFNQPYPGANPGPAQAPRGRFSHLPQGLPSPSAHVGFPASGFCQRFAPPLPPDYNPLVPPPPLGQWAARARRGKARGRGRGRGRGRYRRELAHFAPDSHSLTDAINPPPVAHSYAGVQSSEMQALEGVGGFHAQLYTSTTPPDDHSNFAEASSSFAPEESTPAARTYADGPSTAAPRREGGARAEFPLSCGLRLLADAAANRRSHSPAPPPAGFYLERPPPLATPFTPAHDVQPHDQQATNALLDDAPPRETPNSTRGSQSSLYIPLPQEVSVSNTSNNLQQGSSPVQLPRSLTGISGETSLLEVPKLQSNSPSEMSKLSLKKEHPCLQIDHSNDKVLDSNSHPLRTERDESHQVHNFSTTEMQADQISDIMLFPDSHSKGSSFLEKTVTKDPTFSHTISHGTNVKHFSEVDKITIGESENIGNTMKLQDEANTLMDASHGLIDAEIYSSSIQSSGTMYAHEDVAFQTDNSDSTRTSSETSSIAREGNEISIAEDRTQDENETNAKIVKSIQKDQKTQSMVSALGQPLPTSTGGGVALEAKEKEDCQFDSSPAPTFSCPLSLDGEETSPNSQNEKSITVESPQQQKQFCAPSRELMQYGLTKSKTKSYDMKFLLKRSSSFAGSHSDAIPPDNSIHTEKEEVSPGQEDKMEGAKLQETTYSSNVDLPLIHTPLIEESSKSEDPQKTDLEIEVMEATSRYDVSSDLNQIHSSHKDSLSKDQTEGSETQLSPQQDYNKIEKEIVSLETESQSTLNEMPNNALSPHANVDCSESLNQSINLKSKHHSLDCEKTLQCLQNQTPHSIFSPSNDDVSSNAQTSNSEMPKDTLRDGPHLQPSPENIGPAARKLPKKRDISSPKTTLLSVSVTKHNHSDVKLTNVGENSILETANSSTSSSPKTNKSRKRKRDSSSHKRKHKRRCKVTTAVSAFDSPLGELDGIPLPSNGEVVPPANTQQPPASTQCVPDASDSLQTMALTQHGNSVEQNVSSQNTLSSDSTTQVSLPCDPVSYLPDLEPSTNTASPLEEDRIVSDKTTNVSDSNNCASIRRKKRKPHSQKHEILIDTESKKLPSNITTAQRMPTKNTHEQYSSSNSEVLHRGAYDISKASVLHTTNLESEEISKSIHPGNVTCKESPKKRQKTNSRKSTSNNATSDNELSVLTELSDFTTKRPKKTGKTKSKHDSSNLNYGKKHKKKRKYNADISILNHEDEVMKPSFADPSASGERFWPSRCAVSGRDPKNKDVHSDGQEEESSHMFELEAEQSLLEESKKGGDYFSPKSEVKDSEQEKTLSSEKRLLLRIVSDKSENYRSVCKASLRKKSKFKIRCTEQNLEETPSANINLFDSGSSLFSETNVTSFDDSSIAYENAASNSRPTIEDPEKSKISVTFPSEDEDLLEHSLDEQKQCNDVHKEGVSLPDKNPILRSLICGAPNSNKGSAVDYYTFSEHSYCMRAARNDPSSRTQPGSLEPLELEEIRGSNDQEESCVQLSPVQGNILASASEANSRLASTTSPPDICNEDEDFASQTSSLPKTENPILINVEPSYITAEPSIAPSSPIDALDNPRNEIKITSDLQKMLHETQSANGIKDFSVTNNRKHIKRATSDLSTAWKVTISKNPKLREDSSAKIHQTELRTVNMSLTENKNFQTADDIQLQSMVQTSAPSTEFDAVFVQNTENIRQKLKGKSNLQRERKSEKISIAKSIDTSVSIDVEKVDPNCTKLGNKNASFHPQHAQIILNSSPDISFMQNSLHDQQKKNTGIENQRTKLKNGKKCRFQNAISLARQTIVTPSNVLVPRESRDEGIQRRKSNSLKEERCGTSPGHKHSNQSSTTKPGRTNGKHTSTLLNKERVEISKNAPTYTGNSLCLTSANFESPHNADVENPTNISQDTKNISCECIEMSGVKSNADQLESLNATRGDVVGAEEKLKEHGQSLNATKGKILTQTKDLHNFICSTKDISYGKYKELDEEIQIFIHKSSSQNDSQHVALPETETSAGTCSGAVSQLTKQKLNLKIKNLSNKTNSISRSSGNPNIFQEKSYDERETSKKMADSGIVDKNYNKLTSVSSRKILTEGQPSTIPPSACVDDVTSPESPQCAAVAGDIRGSADRLTKRLRKHRTPRRVSPDIEVVYERTHQEAGGERASHLRECLANMEREKTENESVPCETKHRRNAGYASASNVCNELLSPALFTNGQVELHRVSLTPVSRPCAPIASCVVPNAAFNPLDLSCRPKSELTIIESPSSSLSAMSTSARAEESSPRRPAPVLHETSVSPRSFVYDGNSPENLCLKDILSGATSSDPFPSERQPTNSSSSTSKHRSSESPSTPRSDDSTREKTEPAHQIRPPSPDVIIVMATSGAQLVAPPRTESSSPSAPSEPHGPSATPADLQTTTGDSTRGGRKMVGILPGPSTSNSPENVTNDLHQVLSSEFQFGKKRDSPTASNEKVENLSTFSHVTWRPTTHQSYRNSGIGINEAKRLHLSDRSKSSMSFVDATVIQGTLETEILFQESRSPQNMKPMDEVGATTTPPATRSEEGSEDEQKTSAHFEGTPLHLQSGCESQPRIQSPPTPESPELRTVSMHHIESSNKSITSSHRQQFRYPSPSRKEPCAFATRPVPEEGSILRDAIDLLRMNERMCAQASAQSASAQVADREGFVYHLLETRAQPAPSPSPAPSPEPSAGRSVADILDFLARDDHAPSLPPSPQAPLPSFQRAFSRPSRPQP